MHPELSFISIKMKVCFESSSSELQRAAKQPCQDRDIFCSWHMDEIEAEPVQMELLVAPHQHVPSAQSRGNLSEEICSAFNKTFTGTKQVSPLIIRF